MRRFTHAIPRPIAFKLATGRLSLLRLTAARKSVGLLILPFVLTLSSCENQAYDSVDIVPAQDAVNTAQTTSPQLAITYPEMNSESDTAFIQVAENSLIVAQVDAQDSEDSQLTYRLQDGEDMNKFLIDKNTGTLTFKDLPDWEQPTDSDSNNNYMVLWQVLSSQGSARSQYLIVQVTDLPD